ncbi:hypothetical protein [Streptomyces sp. YS-3]
MHRHHGAPLGTFIHEPLLLVAGGHLARAPAALLLARKAGT